jgi:putative ABC transport system permease protein
MSSLFQDLRYALRTFAKSPGFSAIAVLTLALGIGANAAIFALVDRVLLRLLPVRDPRALVLMRSPGPTQGHTWSDGDDSASFSAPMYRALRDRNTTFDGLIAEYPFAVSIAARGETERAAGELVSGNYFQVLGVAPAIGRVLADGDDRLAGGGPVVVLSHGYWTRRFGADPSVLNQTIVANGQPLTVVGVARRDFPGIQPGRQADLFVPLAMKAQMTPFWNGLDDPKDRWLQLVGRLKPGLTRPSAEKAIAPLYRSLLQEELPAIKGWDAKRRQHFLERQLLFVDGGHGRTVLSSDVGAPLLSLMGMVALVLLIACSNLAGLLAARGAARQREYGIRLAIGASRFQLLRQSIVECLLFAFVGGGLGLLVAAWTLQALLRAFPSEDGLRQLGVTIDPRVLGFAAVVSLVAGLLFGVAPSWRAARLDPARTLRGQGRGATSAGREVIRLRQGLVTAQVALTLVLLVAAGLFARSLRNLGQVDLGFQADQVIGFSVAPKLNGYSPERTTGFARALIERLGALPGVRSVAAASIATMEGSTTSGSVTIEGQDPAAREDRSARQNLVSPAYFATLGIPLVAGREFAMTDDARAPKVAIVNETLARKYFPGASPLGKHISFGGEDSGPPDIEIVGVVRNSKAAQVDEADVPFAYQPYLQDSKIGELTFSLRTHSDPKALAGTIRAAVQSLDPQLPIYDLAALQTRIDDSLVTQRVIVMLSGAFGVLAAVLAALGIYGVLSFAVAARRQEIGVRMALGADPAAVRSLILKEVVRFLLIGGAIGLPCAYALARAIESILFGVKATDVGIFAVGTALMAVVALAAALPPAMRAARTDALDALRSE